MNKFDLEEKLRALLGKARRAHAVYGHFSDGPVEEERLSSLSGSVEAQAWKEINTILANVISEALIERDGGRAVAILVAAAKQFDVLCANLADECKEIKKQLYFDIDYQNISQLLSGSVKLAGIVARIHAAQLLTKELVAILGEVGVELSEISPNERAKVISPDFARIASTR